MCLTPEALALFLNLLAAPVSMEPGVITVHAETRDAEWVRLDGNDRVDEAWCTTIPDE